MRSLWLKNSKGDTFDLMAKKIELGNSTLAFDLNQFGYRDEVTTSQVSSNFVVDNRTPQGSEFSCTMLFANQEHIRLFNDFIQDLDNLGLYYDPKGLILPNTQVMEAWYKRCSFVGIDIPTKGKHGLFECSVSFTFLTAKWLKDTVLSSIAMGISDTVLQFPFEMPFFFYSSGKIGLMIQNDNDETSCKIEITNNSSDSLTRCSWVVYYEDNTRQYAEWMAKERKLINGQRLVVDSELGAEQAYVQINDTIDVVTREQAIGTKFENFVTIKHGKNEILFDFGRIDNIDVLVTYKEQVRMGLVL